MSIYKSCGYSQDPSHEYYKTTRSFFGIGFDPEMFNRATINKNWSCIATEQKKNNESSLLCRKPRKNGLMKSLKLIMKR